MRILEKCGWRSVVFRHQPRMSFVHARCERMLGRRIRREGFPFLDADRLQLIDHGAVAVEPRFGLHHPVEMREEALVEANGGIEQDVLYVAEDCRRRISRL